MEPDVHPKDPSAELLSVAERVTGAWLQRLATAACGPDDGAMPSERIEQIEAATLQRLGSLLRSDVDDQSTNPLSIFRGAAAELTEELADLGAPPVRRDRFETERFPDDIYGFAPARWDDVHPDLLPAGMAWGAWKALTVLRRRHDEGLR